MRQRNSKEIYKKYKPTPFYNKYVSQYLHWAGKHFCFNFNFQKLKYYPVFFIDPRNCETPANFPVSHLQENQDPVPKDVVLAEALMHTMLMKKKIK